MLAADQRKAWRQHMSQPPLDAKISERWRELEAQSSQADLSKAAFHRAYTKFLELTAKIPDRSIRWQVKHFQAAGPRLASDVNNTRSELFGLVARLLDWKDR